MIAWAYQSLHQGASKETSREQEPLYRTDAKINQISSQGFQGLHSEGAFSPLLLCSTGLPQAGAGTTATAHSSSHLLEDS